MCPLSDTLSGQEPEPGERSRLVKLLARNQKRLLIYSSISCQVLSTALEGIQKLFLTGKTNEAFASEENLCPLYVKEVETDLVIF